MTNNQPFTNKIVLVTGGGSGIGRVSALAFAQQGATLVIADVDETGGQETVRLIAQDGAEAHFIHTDVSQTAQVEALIAETVARYGRLDCAFNNAGVEGEITRMADISEADFDRTMAVNIKGVWLCMKYEIQQMIRQGHGSIVNIASVAGIVGAHSMSVYAASKHAVIGLTKSAAVEYAKDKIRINAVCPSVVRTAMMERAFEQSPKLETTVTRINPSRRLGEPEEVATAVTWLCSDAASYINGVALPIDGGFSAQ